MKDPTENTRRKMAEALNSEPGTREYLESHYGQVWSTDQLTRDFTVTGFAAPFVVVIRKSDGAIGTLWFQHSPRFYWGFKED